MFGAFGLLDIGHAGDDLLGDLIADVRIWKDMEVGRNLEQGHLKGFLLFGQLAFHVVLALSRLVLSRLHRPHRLDDFLLHVAKLFHLIAIFSQLCHELILSFLCLIDPPGIQHCLELAKVI